MTLPRLRIRLGCGYPSLFLNFLDYAQLNFVQNIQYKFVFNCVNDFLLMYGYGN